MALSYVRVRRWPAMALAVSLLDAAAALDDASALLQASAAESLLHRELTETALLRAVQGGEGNTTVDCATHPALCRPPFSCRASGPLPLTGGADGVVALQRLSPSGRRASSGVFATADGHANMNSYCGHEEQFAMLECAAGNLTGYAKLKRFGESQGVLDDFHHDFMAQYCFYVGHCDNEEVHNGMGLHEAEAMCDRDFGHESWARFSEGGVTRTRVLSVLGGTLKMKLFTTEGAMKLKLGLPSARGMGKIACGQGHYHCDIQNCKDNYCSSEKYWKKYHHRLPGK